MTENLRVFDSEFHRRYVGGDGVVCEGPIVLISPMKTEIRPTTYEEVLADYRRYVGDPKAELPDEIKKTLLAINRTENGRA
ncbi:MAG TPA: hypothetical protein PLI45_00270 [Candidatus Woesebacteria bacterium]|nr:hypothetical protein [Candidatus Woesebacteria bacterium]